MIQALGLGGLEAHAPDGCVRPHWTPADFQNSWEPEYPNKSHLQAKNTAMHRLEAVLI
jgi:hypothetical protein